jgi:hypothetical protein
MVSLELGKKMTGRALFEKTAVNGGEANARTRPCIFSQGGGAPWKRKQTEKAAHYVYFVRFYAARNRYYTDIRCLPHYIQPSAGTV